MHTKKDEGFTLIELLIVIVILGILATVTVFAVGGITDQGRESACAAGLKTHEVAVEAYVAQTGSPPEDRDAIIARGFLRDDGSDVWEVDEGDIQGSGDCSAYSSEWTEPVTD